MRYEVVAVQDVSKAPHGEARAADGRVIETDDADAVAKDDVAAYHAKRCLKLVLRDERDGALRLALEARPLAGAVAVGDAVEVDAGTEERHGVLVLVPERARVVRGAGSAGVPQAVHPPSLDAIDLSDVDFDDVAV